MNLKTFKPSFIAAGGLALLGLAGCQETLQEILDNPNPGPVMTVKLARIPEDANSKTEIALFQFTEGALKKKILVDGASDSEPIVFSKEESARIYALSGISVAAEEGLTAEGTFYHMTAQSQSGADSAPMFYSSVTTTDGETNELDIKLIRGVGRIDVINEDADLRISEAKVDNAPGETYLFPVSGEVCASEPVSYVRSYPSGMPDVEKGAFMVFESKEPVSLVIKDVSGAEASEITVTLPAIVRNKVYTVTLSKDDPDDPSHDPVEVHPVVTVSDWDEDDVYSTPDNVNGILVDVEASHFPAGVRYDTSTGILHVPHTGIEKLDIAFKADLRVDVDTVMMRGYNIELETENPEEEEEVIGFWWLDEDTGEWEWVVWGEETEPEEPRFTMLGHTVTERNKDVLTTYSMKIKPQITGHREYTLSVSLRKASMASVYDHLKILIEGHPKQLQTVKIGGREWMCFNATSQDMEDQIYPLDGLSVDEMYNEHFADCLGNFFQYGKVHSFSPWTSNNPNEFASDIPDIPWINAEYTPLPRGFHVATAEDWKALIPNGTTLPAQWTTPSGETIRGTVVTLPGTLTTPSAAANRRNFQMRYVLFESLSTGAKLYFPLGGMKGNNTAEVPDNVGTRAGYWQKENQTFKLLEYKATADKTDGAVVRQDLWNYNGFLFVRGVRNIPTQTPNN